MQTDSSLDNQTSTVFYKLKQLFPAHCHDRIFLVGGSVRDSLLGKSAKDIDLAVSLTSAELESSGFCPVNGKSTVPIWFRHEISTGTLEVIQLHDKDALSDDLLRRDFSINAMAMTLAGELIDPLNGYADLTSGVLRACSERTFIDDPLRILRAFRFESDGWRIPAETAALIRCHDWSRSFGNIPVERFSREMVKALSSPNPVRFFRLMLEFRIGTEYLPELFRMPDIPAGPLAYHPEGDLFAHSTEVLQRVAENSSEALARFCGFFHDIGKLATDHSLYPKHHGHDQAGFQLALTFCDRLRLPAKYRKALAWVSRLHTTFNLWNELKDSTRLRMAEHAIKAGITTILPIVANADKAGVFKAAEWENVLRVAGMTVTELGIDVAKLADMKKITCQDLILQKRIDILREQRRLL